jgi:excisionase family DNA binding protein
MKDLMGVKDAAAMLGISDVRVLQLIHEGVIPTVGKMGRSYVLDRATIARLAREGWPGRRPPPNPT